MMWGTVSTVSRRRLLHSTQNAAPASASGSARAKNGYKLSSQRFAIGASPLVKPCLRESMSVRNTVITFQGFDNGVAGGSILQGVLRVGGEIEVRPGIVTKKESPEGGSGATTVVCSPIFSRISSLYAESNDLQYAVPGGLIGVGTRIDPTLTRADRLVGQVLGLRGKLPKVFAEIEISYYLLRRLLGVKTSDGGKQAKVQKLAKGEILMVNIGSTTGTGGKVEGAKSDLAKISLTQPVCMQEGEKIALSRRVDKHWRLIGWGEIKRGKKIEVLEP